MCMKFKNKDLQNELEDQSHEVGRLKIKLAKEQEEMCKKPKELEETRRVSIGLQTQLEEAKRIEDVMKLQLAEKEKENQRLEMEIVGLRKKIEKSKDHVKFNESSVILDEIMKCKRLSSNKAGLGFRKEEYKLKEVSWSPKTPEAESSKAVHAPVHTNKEV